MKLFPITASNSISPRDVAEDTANDGTSRSNHELVDWIGLVENIRAGESSAIEELYRIFHKGIWFYIQRTVGPQNLEDTIHDTFVIVLQAIRRGELREPERLMGFVRTVVRRQVSAHIERAVQNRRDINIELEDARWLADIRNNPEQSVLLDEQTDLIVQVLCTLSPRNREILTRFYLHEQSEGEICEEMGLTPTQFRLLKTRAKKRFGEFGRQRLHCKPPRTEKILRKFAVA